MSDSPPLFVLDWDGSLWDGFLLLHWSRYLEKHSLFHGEALIKLERIMAQYHDGHLSYDALARLAPALFARGSEGYAAAAHTSLADDYINTSEFQDRLGSLASILADELASPARYAALVSGAPQIPLSAAAKRLDVDIVFGVRVACDQRGNQLPVLLDNPALADRKAEIVDGLQLVFDVVLAVGDSESDIPLFAAADYQVVIGDRVGTVHATGNGRSIVLPNLLFGTTEASHVRDFLARAGTVK